MNTLFGFGGFRMSCGGYSADFPENTGKIFYKAVRQQWITSDNIARHKHLGFQPEISVQLHNLKLSQHIAWENMIAVLNQHLIYGTPIIIRPRFNFEQETGLSYSCELISDFSPDDISNSEVGQSIDLVFRATTIHKTLPNMFSGSKIYNLVDYTGAAIVDHTGAQIIALN